MPNHIVKFPVQVTLSEIPTARPGHDQGIQGIGTKPNRHETRIGDTWDFGARSQGEVRQTILIPLWVHAGPAGTRDFLDKDLISKRISADGIENPRNFEGAQDPGGTGSAVIIIDPNHTGRAAIHQRTVQYLLQFANIGDELGPGWSNFAELLHCLDRLEFTNRFRRPERSVQVADLNNVVITDPDASVAFAHDELGQSPTQAVTAKNPDESLPDRLLVKSGDPFLPVRPAFCPRPLGRQSPRRNPEQTVLGLIARKVCRLHRFPTP